MKYVYAMKNRLVGGWLDPQFDYMPPEDRTRHVNSFCILKPEDALKQGLNDLDMYLLGQYDDEKGAFVLLEEPKLLIELNQPFEQLRKARAALESAADGNVA